MYLKKQYRTWHAYHDIPREAQEAIGKRRFVNPSTRKTKS